MLVHEMWEHSEPLVWLNSEIKTLRYRQPLELRQASSYARRLQNGERLALPHSRPMPIIGPRCHELRINDETRTWRVVYRIDDDAIIVAAVFEKRTPTMPIKVIATCKLRFRAYDQVGA
jgi:phage-related protein